MYEDNETLKTACGSPCYAAPEVTEFIFIFADDSREEIPRTLNRHLEQRCGPVRDGLWVLAIRRSKDF